MLKEKSFHVFQLQARCCHQWYTHAKENPLRNAGRELLRDWASSGKCCAYLPTWPTFCNPWMWESFKVHFCKAASKYLADNPERVITASLVGQAWPSLHTALNLMAGFNKLQWVTLQMFLKPAHHQVRVHPHLVCFHLKRKRFLSRDMKRDMISNVQSTLHGWRSIILVSNNHQSHWTKSQSPRVVNILTLPCPSAAKPKSSISK